jgi:hypothetical protein
MKTILPPRGEIAARGEFIYEERIRRHLEPAHEGQFAIINIETGEYEVDQNHLAASTRAATRWPDGLLYAVRIGSPTLGHIGARFRKAN